jgi:BolA protein
MKDFEQHLTNKVTKAINPFHLEVINESHNHSGPSDQSHFKLVIVSDYFNDLKLIDRHRFVNQLFKEELNSIHALAMHTYTQKEWLTKNNNYPNSPKCSNK